MIEQLLPACVASVEARHSELDVRLFPEEEVLVGNAVEKRRREFTTARACARAALGQIGLPVAPILTGERGEPLWPQEVVGSITHCESYRACAVARSSEILTIGIDAEPNAALPEGLLADIARPEELPELQHLATEHGDVRWDRLLFSAKESVYKAWFPLAKRWLGFEDARITFDPSSYAFTARLLVPGPVVAGQPLRGFSGTWMVNDGLVATAIAVRVL
jgi:4'-phosphopantetheinyl transferase EntD